MNRDRLPAVFSPRRCLMHIPVGILAALALEYIPSVGWGILLLFCFYEFTEDWRIKDHCYIDVIGALIGMYVVAAFILFWRML
jgi:hypothetical protein